MPKTPFPRLKLRHMLFFMLLLVGIVPMLVSSALLVGQNRDLLENQERDILVNEAVADSRNLTYRLVGMRKQLHQAGLSLLLSDQGRAWSTNEAPEPWLIDNLSALNANNPSVVSVYASPASGEALATNRDMPREVLHSLGLEMTVARQTGNPQYGFAVTDGERPMATLAVPVSRPATNSPGVATPEPEEPADDVPLDPTEVGEADVDLVMAAVMDLSTMGALAPDTATPLDTAIIDEEGRVVWSRGLSPEARVALSESPPVRGFVRQPLGQLSEYTAEVDGEEREMLVRLAPLGETGWALVAQRPRAAAFQAADRLVVNTLLASLLVVLLALVVAAVAARRLSEPVQRLAETSHEIAAGNFGRRVETGGLTLELAELAADFNRMGNHVELYVDELQRAAQANRELFIGSLRAFAAAIDAKDPYTRGHSERVASLSRTISRHLGMSDEDQHQIWIAALLHDVGKIGVDDRILKKSGVLTDDEFAQMKAHTVIGEEILTPIVDLRPMLPVVRLHHENWNGRGYPDGLKGEQIPLMARVVAVADTFDAVTTNRPYQEAYSLEDAVATIRRLVGSRFDAKVVTAFLRAYEGGEIRLPRIPAKRAVSAV